MTILFRNNRLKKVCCHLKVALKTYGKVRGELLIRRMNELHAASCLDDIRCLPQARCHELKGKSKGKLSVDLQYTYRLIIEPANNPIPRKPDGGLDWKNVKTITIIGVEDTHDKKSA